MKIKNQVLIKIINQLVLTVKRLDLDLIGLMCIPPANIDPEVILKK